MGGNLTVVTDDSFETQVLNAGKPALVDFWAVWCGPCRMIAPHVEALADEYAGRAVVAKVDVDSNKQWAIKYGIQSIPTLLFFKDGQMVDKHVGTITRDALAAKIDAIL